MEFQEDMQKKVKKLLQFLETTLKNEPKFISCIASIENLFNNPAIPPLEKFKKILNLLRGFLHNSNPFYSRLQSELRTFEDEYDRAVDALNVTPDILDIQYIIGAFYEREGLIYIHTIIDYLKIEFARLSNEIRMSCFVGAPWAPFHYKKDFFRRVIFQSTIALNEALNNIQNIASDEDILKIRFVIKNLRTILEHPSGEDREKMKSLLSSDALIDIIHGLFLDLQNVTVYLDKRIYDLRFCECSYRLCIHSEWEGHLQMHPEILDQDRPFYDYDKISKTRNDNSDVYNKYYDEALSKRKRPVKKIITGLSTHNTSLSSKEIKNFTKTEKFKNEIVYENCEKRIKNTSTDATGLAVHIPMFDHLRRYFNTNYQDSVGNGYPLWDNTVNVLDYNTAVKLLVRTVQDNSQAKPKPSPLTESDFYEEIKNLLIELEDFLLHGLPIEMRYRSSLKQLAHRPTLLNVLNNYPLHRLYLINILSELHYYIEIWIKDFNVLEGLSDSELHEIKEIFKDLKICRNFSTHDIWRNKEQHSDAIACITIQLHERFRKIFKMLDSKYAFENIRTEKLRAFISKLNCDLNSDQETLIYELNEIIKESKFSIYDPICCIETERDLNSLLFHIIEKRYPLLLTRILNFGANPNTRNLDGNTLLHAAAQLTELNSLTGKYIADVLVSAGALPNLKNRFGQTPWDLAQNPNFKKNFTTNQPFLRQASADQAHNMDPDFHYCLFDYDYLNKLLSNENIMLFLMDNKGYLPAANYLYKCLNDPRHQLTKEQLKMFKSLIDKNADVNQEDIFGNTVENIMEERYNRENMLERINGNNPNNRLYADPEMHELLIMRLQQEGEAFLDNRIFRVLPPLGQTVFDHLEHIERTRYGEETHVLLPYNIDNNHWVGVVIHIPEGVDPNAMQVRVEYYDPLRNSSFDDDSIKQQNIILGVIQNTYRNAAIIPSEQLGNFYRQDNNYDCGPLTVENLVLAGRRIANANANMNTRPDDNFRQQHAGLIENIVDPEQAPQNANPYENALLPVNQQLTYIERLLKIQEDFTPMAVHALLGNWIFRKHSI